MSSGAKIRLVLLGVFCTFSLLRAEISCYQKIVGLSGSITIPQIPVTKFDYDSVQTYKGSPNSRYVIMRTTKNGKEYYVKIAQGEGDAESRQRSEEGLAQEFANYTRLLQDPEAAQHIPTEVALKRSKEGLYLEIAAVKNSVNIEDLFRFRSRSWKNGAESLGDFLVVAIESAQSVDFLHKNDALHFDINPTNLVMGSEGVRIIDLEGLAFAEKDGSYNYPGVHSPKYMPDELRVNSIYNSAGPATDIYSWSATMKEMYQKYVKRLIPTLKAGNNTKLIQIDDRLRQLFARNAETNPARRHQNMREVIALLQNMQLELYQ